MFQNPDYMKENFIIKIETMHIADRGETENVGFLMFCDFIIETMHIADRGETENVGFLMFCDFI